MYVVYVVMLEIIFGITSSQVAQSELDRLRSGYEEERKRREGDLRERHQVVQLRKQIKVQADR